MSAARVLAVATASATQTTKAGHGAVNSPTRRNLPASTSGFVMNFSQKKTSALPAANASTAPVEIADGDERELLDGPTLALARARMPSGAIPSPCG